MKDLYIFIEESQIRTLSNPKIWTGFHWLIAQIIRNPLPVVMKDSPLLYSLRIQPKVDDIVTSHVYV